MFVEKFTNVRPRPKAGIGRSWAPAAGGRHGVRSLALIVLVLAGLGSAPRPGRALDIGLTPAQVYAIWANVNDSLLAVARRVSRDAAWNASLAASAPRPARGKTLDELLERIAGYRAKLDAFRRRGGPAPSERPPAPERATALYLNSAYALNGSVDWLVHQTGPHYLVSRFYRRRDPGNKTLDEVFALVDLAERRLDLILRRAGTSRR